MLYIHYAILISILKIPKYNALQKENHITLVSSFDDVKLNNLSTKAFAHRILKIYLLATLGF